MKVISKSEIDSYDTASHCDKHGDFEVRFTPHFRQDQFFVNEWCPKCANEAKKRKDEEERIKQEKFQEERLLSNKISSGVPKRNVSLKFDDFNCLNEKQSAVKNKVTNWLNKFNEDKSTCPSMIITGSVGTGKTMLCSCIINSITEPYSRKGRMIKLIDMIRKLKDTWRRDSERTEIEMIEHFSNIPLLIIDEVGMSFDSDTEKMFIFDVIDGRYQNKLPTIIISNLNIEGIKNSIGERVVDRLRDGGGVLVGCDWGSFRK